MGVAIITGGPNDFHFRIDPNLITWQYKLNTHVDETYGGKVIQLLSVSITNLTIQSDSGRGGRDYLKKVITFTRDLLLWQKENPDKVVKFVYSPRGYNFTVHLTGLSMSDSLDNITFPYSFNFNVNEDVSGIATDKVMSAELARLQEGVGFKLSKYVGDGTLDPLGTGISATAPSPMPNSGWSSSAMPERAIY